MKPRVAIDVRLWRHTGIGRYIRNLAPRLTGVDLIAYAAPEDLEAVSEALPEAAVRPCPARPFSVQELLFWHKELRGQPLALFHAPHLNVPLSGDIPLVVTIHDLIPMRFPGTINSRLGSLYFLMMSHLAVGRARRVIAVSEHTRKDLLALVGADPAKIAVIGEGADPRFALPHDPARLAALRDRLGLGDRYVLYAGQWKRYKNLETLIAAFAALRDRSGFADLKLVLAGREDPSQPHVIEAIRARGLDEAVVRTGYLEDEADLVALYQGAAVFAFPSRYEGFGLPPLEAMAAGVPVVAAKAASIPEVVGDAAILVDPEDVVKWAQALELALTDPALRRRLVELGRARVQDWSWDRAARQTLDVYHQVLQGTPS